MIVASGHARLLLGAGLAGGLSAALAAQVPPPPENAPMTPALRRLLEREDGVERVATGHSFLDGMAWHADGYLVFTDSPRGQILKLTPPDAVTTLSEASGGAAGLAVDADGRLIAAERFARRVTRIDRDGRTETLAERVDGQRLSGPSDVALGPDGSIYFTDLVTAATAETGGREIEQEGVFRIAPDGAVTSVVGDGGRPSGLVVSPDGATLYVSDATRLQVRAYAIAPDGRVGAGRTLAVVQPWKRGVQGTPDGLALDAQGHLYLAGPGGVWVFGGGGGRLGVIATPETPSACAFGDRDGRTLYVAARAGLYRVRLKVKGATTRGGR